MELPSARAARWLAYEDRSRLVEDPEGVEEARALVRPWSEEERRVFMDKFLAHHKARGGGIRKNVKGTMEGSGMGDWDGRGGTGRRAACRERGICGHAPPTPPPTPTQPTHTHTHHTTTTTTTTTQPPTHPPPRALLQDFQRIATFLPGRTPQEVIALYYSLQKSDEFAQVGCGGGGVVGVGGWGGVGGGCTCTASQPATHLIYPSPPPPHAPRPRASTRCASAASRRTPTAASVQPSWA